MSSICESCGAPEARLYAFYPAVLCPECVGLRVAERKAAEAYKEAAQRQKAAESAPDPAMQFSEPDPESTTTTQHTGGGKPEIEPIETQEQRLAREARSRKRARKVERRDAAKIAFEVAKRTLAAQAALVRVQLNSGDEHATIAIAKSLMQSFIQTGYVSLTGALTHGMELDQMAAAVRAANLIDSDGLAAIIAALSSNGDVAVKAGLYLNAIDVLSLGYEPRQKARRSRRKRILAEGRRMIESFDAAPSPDATHLANIPTDDDLHPGCSYRIFAERVDDPSTHYRVAGKQFDDSPDGLRSLANQIIGLQKSLPAGYRARVLSLDPDTLQPVRSDNHSETLEVAGGAQTAIAGLGIIHESEVIKVLGVDWTTWERDYRNRIPGRMTEKGRFYLQSDLQDWFAKHSTSSEIQAAQSAGGAQ